MASLRFARLAAALGFVAPLFCAADALQAQKPKVEAVGLRLRKAIEAGEITSTQARAMLAALKNAKPRVPSELQGLREKFGAAVQAGEMTRDEAIRKYREMMAQKGNADDRSEQLMAVRKKLAALVDAGRLSKTDANGKYLAYAKKLKAQQGEESARDSKKGYDDEVERQLVAVGKELSALVQAGRLTEADAKEKYRAYAKELGGKHHEGEHDEKHAGQGDQPTVKSKLMAAKKKLSAAMESGKMTRQEAVAAYKKYADSIGAKVAGATEAKAEDKAEKTYTRKEFVALRKEIKAAQKAGELSRRDAREKMRWLRSRLESRKDRQGERKKKGEDRKKKRKKSGQII